MRYVIWDFDGTLAWRKGRFSGALQSLLQEHLLANQIDLAKIKSHLGKGFPWHTPENPHPELTDADQWWLALNPLFANALAACGVEHQHAHELAPSVRSIYCDPQYWRLYDDTIPTLNTLQEQGWQHILLSNHVPELRQLVEVLGLSTYFVAIFNSAETSYEKPHPRAFQNVIDSLDSSAQLWMVGDSWSADIEGASVLGIPAILVRDSHPNCRWSSPTLEDVIPLLELNR